MITNSLFPVLSPDAADHANLLVASQAWSSRVGVPLDLGIAARSDLGACSAPLNCLVDLPLVISAVGGDTVDFPRHFFQQRLGLVAVVPGVGGEHFGHNLLCVGVDRQVLLPPRAALTRPVLPHFPFTFAEHFEARSVADHI